MAQDFDVLLHGRPIGGITRVGSTAEFRFDEDYLADPNRAVLGLRFEEGLRLPFRADNRMPVWFANLLPEGSYRDYLEARTLDRRRITTEYERDAILFSVLGEDLPGAVDVQPVDPGRWAQLRGPDSVSGPGASDLVLGSPSQASG